MPHLDFVDSGKFSFPENSYNMSPFNKGLPQFVSTVSISGSALAQVIETDRDSVMTVIKEIFAKFVITITI